MKLPRRRRESLAAIKRQRTARLGRVMARAAYLQQRGREDQVYTLVCNEFVRLGGVYVKFLQGVLLNSVIMQKWHSADKLKIFEGLDYQPIDILKLLRNELSPSQLQDIVEVQPEPFAAGSFGQVYYGRHRDGTAIVVKVLRPNVRELLRYDLRLLSLFSKFFVNRQYQNVDVKLEDALRDFRRATLAETDYVAEAEFADQLYQAYTGNGQLIIPRTYLNLCTPHLIVQEYINGLSLAKLLELQQKDSIDIRTYVQQELGSDIVLQLQTLGIASLIGSFELPKIMGDPHPGNIRLLPDNKIALIDFGIAAHAPHNRAAFFGLLQEWSKLYSGQENIVNLFEQYMRFFVNDLYRALKKLTGLRPQTATSGKTNLIEDVGKMIQDIFVNAVGSNDVRAILQDGRVLQIFNQIVNKGNRFGFIMRFESSEILRAAQTYMTTVEAMGLRTDVLPVVFEQVVAETRRQHPEYTAMTDKNLTISQALEIANSWLERVATRDPMLFRQLMSKLGNITKRDTVEATPSETEAKTEVQENA